MRRRPTGPVDWAQIKQRLAQVEDTLSRGRDADPQRRRAVLEARARALAAEAAPSRVAVDGIELVEFELGAERYAIDADCVREVRPLSELTDLPCTPACVSGIINVHGRIIAVIDLKTFFERPESGLSDLNKVIILQHRDVELGVLADRITGTTRVSPAQLSPAPTVIGASLARHLRGVAAGGEWVLDARSLASDPALLVNQEVLP